MRNYLQALTRGVAETLDRAKPDLVIYLQVQIRTKAIALVGLS